MQTLLEKIKIMTQWLILILNLFWQIGTACISVAIILSTAQLIYSEYTEHKQEIVVLDLLKRTGFNLGFLKNF